MYPGGNQRGAPLSYSSSNLAVPRFLQPSPLMFPSRQPLGFPIAASQGLSSGCLPNYLTQLNSSHYIPPFSVNSYPTHATMPLNEVYVSKVSTTQPGLTPLPCLAPTVSRVALGEINPNKHQSGRSQGDSSSGKASRPLSLQSIDIVDSELAMHHIDKSEISVDSPSRRSRFKGELVSIRVAEIEKRINN